MAPLVPPLLLLFLLSTATATSSSSLDMDHGEVNHHHHVVVAVEPSPVCQGHRVNPPAGGGWVPLSRPHGPCSPEGDATPAPASMADTLRWDQHRAAYIQRKLAGESQATAVLEDSESSQVGHQGTVSPNLGNKTPPPPPSGSAVELDVSPAATGPGGRPLPGVTQTMVIDTASDVPWVQCAPCPAPQCHPQTDVLYDPTKSGTYAPFPCTSPTCRQLGPYANGCTGGPNSGQCQYRVSYPDGSASSGTYISDLLTLNANPNGAISGFKFGCSHALIRPGSFSNKTAGIMALGHGAQSLPSQTKATFGHVFSYCLPPTDSQQGFFVLGVPKHAASRYTVTPMLRSKVAPMLYLVRLNAIDVAGQRLPVPPVVFAAGAVMDSRTIITRLPPTAYMALRSAFRAQMKAYRAVPPKGQLDTCYDFTGVPGGGVKVPKVTLVFDGPNAAVELDPSGILLDSCLAFAPNTDDRMTGIIGNVQQQTLEVLYNVGGGTVGFRHAAC